MVWVIRSHAIVDTTLYVCNGLDGSLFMVVVVNYIILERIVYL